MKAVTFAAVLMLSTAAAPFAAAASEADALKDASAILTAESNETERPTYSPGHGVNFKPSDHVFVKSALAVDFTYRNASVTLPLFRGLSPLGKDVFYIITEASDFDVARRMGVNYAPKLVDAIGSPGAQNVTLQDGVMKFAGNVDFSPEYKVVPGDPPGYFPPKAANPGAVADDQWSSIVVLPSGLVLNAQIVQNASGQQLRVKAIDVENRTVTLSLLDAAHDGKQYFYHLVTDASAPVPAVLEKGVFAAKLAKIPQFGKSLPGEKSALLAFSPMLNGCTGKGSGEDQGFSTALANGGIDPINVFPIGPDNDNPSRENNYSPLWDAHVSMWTQAAIDAGKVHRIHSIDEQKSLIREGLLSSASINPSGPGNPYVGGLRPTQAIINCPVIAQPICPRSNSIRGGPRRLQRLRTRGSSDKESSDFARRAAVSSNDIRVVLVHGAWADGSSWARVIAPLAADGVKAAAAPLPLTSFRDDVAALDRTLERAAGPVVLVGHAYAGAVIAATRREKVKALVYVSALAPDEGETVADVFYRGEPHSQAPKLAPDAHGLIYLPEAAFAAAFAHNASREELAVLAAVQRPISPACITVKVERPLWKDRPTWYLLAEQDRMIVRDNQRFMAERMKARLRSLPVDHAALVTAPSSVLDIIREAIDQAV